MIDLTKIVTMNALAEQAGLNAVIVPRSDFEALIVEMERLKQRVADQESLIAPGSDQIWKAVEELYDALYGVDSNFTKQQAALQHLMDVWNEMLG